MNIKVFTFFISCIAVYLALVQTANQKRQIYLDEIKRIDACIIGLKNFGNVLKVNKNMLILRFQDSQYSQMRYLKETNAFYKIVNKHLNSVKNVIDGRLSVVENEKNKPYVLSLNFDGYEERFVRDEYNRFELYSLYRETINLILYQHENNTFYKDYDENLNRDRIKVAKKINSILYKRKSKIMNLIKMTDCVYYPFDQLILSVGRANN